MIKKILLAILLIAPMSMMAQKVAHFDYQKVLQGIPEYQKAVGDLETLGKKYESDLKSMQNEIVSKQDNYKKTADSLPDNMRARKEQEIQDLYTRYQQAQQDNQDAFQKAQQEKLQPIMTKVFDAVNAIAKEDGYTYIIDKTAAATNYIFINESLSEDVTSKVMTRVGSSATAAPRTGAATTPRVGTRTPARGTRR